MAGRGQAGGKKRIELLSLFLSLFDNSSQYWIVKDLKDGVPCISSAMESNGKVLARRAFFVSFWRREQMETENVQYWKYHNQNFTIGTSSSFGSPVGSAIVL